MRHPLHQGRAIGVTHAFVLSNAMTQSDGLSRPSNHRESRTVTQMTLMTQNAQKIREVKDYE